MKTIIFFVLIFITNTVYGQDYFAVVKKNDQVTYNYPESSVFTLEDPKGNKTILQKDEAIDVTGDYTLYVENYWSKEPEVIKANGGRLEIFILPVTINNKADDFYSESTTYHKADSTHATNKPYLESKIINQPVKEGPYELLVIFSNGLVFKYYDQMARAWLDGKEVEVTNRYLVHSPEGLLKLSFDPADGEFWYVFDANHKKI